MAQLRRHPNVLHSYLGSHNINGNSDRVEQREKAKIERVQTSDLETNKKPSSSPLFPPPRKVNDSSDEITKTIKKSLGDYNNFVKIMNQEVSREKAPGQTCIGVMPVPPTPTENKTPHFPSSNNKAKPKDKPINSASSQEKPKGNAGIEKSDSKQKSTLDSSRHKSLKLGEKLNEKKDNKDTKNKISLEKYKSNQATVSVGDKSNTLQSINKHKSSTCVKDDTTTNNISQEENNEVEKVVKKEETVEPAQQEPIKKMEKSTPVQKTKPTPLLLPTRNASSSSVLQSPQHREMKVQHILKEMTETVNMPLTGICTPLPAKKDSHFSFPNNVKEKENSEVPDQTNSFIADLDISDDEDSEDERENLHDQSLRPAQTRSRSSSSSSSSSSGDSSDSEAEEANDDEINPNTVPKTSMLNATSPTTAVKTPSPEPTVTATPKHDANDNLGKSIDGTLHMQTSSKSTSDEISCNSRTSPSKPDDTNILEKSDEDILNKDCKSSTDKAEDQNNEPKSSDKVKATSPSAGQKHTHSLNRTKTESKESLSDTKIRIKVEKGSNDSFRVKTDSKIKSESKKKSESEVGDVKTNAEKSKTAEKNGELNSKSYSKNVKLKKNGNGVVAKIKKISESKEEKIEAKKKNKKTDEQPVVQKKTKRKHKDSTGESGKSCKDNSDPHSSKEKSDVNVSKEKAEINKAKTDELSSKDRNRTKSGNKEKKKSDRTESFGFDILNDEVEEEDSVIDVVGDGSPLVKKKKADNAEKQTKINGVHKNGHVDMPLGIQLVHDKDKDPTSLIVKIPLSFLKRIPSKFGEDLSVESSRADTDSGSLKDGEKTPKDWSGKKNGQNGDMEVDHIEEIEKKRQLSNNGKRSSSWDSGHVKKRIRRDSQRDKSVTEQKKCKTLAEMNAECQADIRRVEPDAHLLQAKTLKREADKLTDKEAKSRTYVEAIVRFICCGKALEDKEDGGELRSVQMYSETTDLLRFILKHVLGRTEDKRLLILCLRVQSLLLHKLYRIKSKQAIKNTQILAEHFKTTHKNNITSPYTTSNKSVSTPSPMSPTPSPAGSVGSIGSNGSNSSGEGNNSHNGRHVSTASVTSPISVSIPQRIHGVMAQHVSSTSKLVTSIDMWDKADNLASDYQEYFTTVDSICGALTFHSSIPHIVNYVKNSLSNFHEHGKET